MKIYNTIGSKERFLEIFQGVNKLKLNEDVVMNGGSNGILEKSFNDLRNKRLRVDNTESRVEGNDTFVELKCTNENGIKIQFSFKATSNNTDIDDVISVDSAQLESFSFDNPSQPINMDVNELQGFNEQHGDDLIDIISEYAGIEDDAEMDDSLYNEAVNFIDKVPFRKGTEQMQTNKAYADQKPTNPNLRVKSPELDKFVTETNVEDIEKYQPTDDEKKTFELPDDFNMSDFLDNDEENYDEEDFQENSVIDVNTDDMVKQGYEKTLSDDTKAKYIMKANIILMKHFKEIGKVPPREEFIALVKEGAMSLYRNDSKNMNEADDKGEYPDQLGKKFKPKNQFPKKKKKPQSVVKLTEDDYSFLDDENDDLEIPNERGAQKYAQADLKKDFSNQDDDDMNGRQMSHDEKFNESDEENPENINQYSNKLTAADAEGVSTEPDFDKMDVGNEEPTEELEGGKGDDKSPSDFDSEQISMGIKVEMEHTTDPKIALEIVLDHLTEIPDYYTRLAKMEADAKGEGESEANSDEDSTNALLGFKPHNVGDYSGEESLNEGDLSDYVDAHGNTEIWYVKPEFFRDFIHGYDDLQKYSPDKIPNSNNLEKTHALLGTIAETDLNKIFDKLNNWGDGNEVNQLIHSKGLDHTSMSVGDIIKINGKAMMVDSYGFKDLDSGVDNVSTTGGVEFHDTNSSMTENDEMEEYQGNTGDRYQDGEGNQFTVRNKVKGGVSLQGQGGEKEIATKDIGFLKKLGENGTKGTKPIITEQQVKLARQVLKDRDFSNKMTKKEAVQILITHNIK